MDRTLEHHILHNLRQSAPSFIIHLKLVVTEIFFMSSIWITLQIRLVPQYAGSAIFRNIACSMVIELLYVFTSTCFGARLFACWCVTTQWNITVVPSFISWSCKTIYCMTICTIPIPRVVTKVVIWEPSIEIILWWIPIGEGIPRHTLKTTPGDIDCSPIVCLPDICTSTCFRAGFFTRSSQRERIS